MKSDAEPIRKVLSVNIKKYRIIFQFTQEMLAEKTGLSTQTVNDIEGCRRWVSPKTLSRLAKAFNIFEYQLLLPENNNLSEKTGDFSQQTLIALQKKIKNNIDAQFQEIYDCTKLQGILPPME